MRWREFEILGAYRETGEPARLLVEAASEDDATEYAASQGVLVSRVVERSPSPRAEDGATGNADASAHLRFGSKFVPDLDLFPRETIVARYDAGPSELGVFGIVFSHRRRLVLTDRRVIVYDKRWLDSRLESVRISSVGAVVLGVRVQPGGATLGVLLALVALVFLLRSGSSILHAGNPAGAGSLPMDVVYGSALLLIALVVLIEARSRVIGVVAEGRFHGIALKRFRARRTSIFINALERMLHVPDARRDFHEESTEQENADAP